jgi:hypothetical protein
VSSLDTRPIVREHSTASGHDALPHTVSTKPIWDRQKKLWGDSAVWCYPVFRYVTGVYAQTLGMFQSLLKSMAYCENCQRAVVCQSFQKSLKRSAASWV